MKKVLYLSLKTEWYRMIESGEKPEEYREITDFWFKRLVRSVIDGKKYIKIPWDDITPEYIKNGLKKDLVFVNYTHAELSLGYPKKGDRSKRMTKEIESISIGIGKLKEWAKQIYENACAHGWHEDSKPDKLWMCLVMSEVAEAVEADRKHISVNGNIAGFEKLTGVGHDFKTVYKDYVKGSVAEELADVVIRLLDYAYMRWGDKFPWYLDRGQVPTSDNFAVNAFTFVKDVLNYGSMNIVESIYYVIAWADQLGIDLVWHIEHKMKYNELRSYKHGGKKY